MAYFEDPAGVSLIRVERWGRRSGRRRRVGEPVRNDLGRVLAALGLAQAESEQDEPWRMADGEA